MTMLKWNQSVYIGGQGALPLMRLNGEASLACLAITVLHAISCGSDYLVCFFMKYLHTLKSIHYFESYTTTL